MYSKNTQAVFFSTIIVSIFLVFILFQVNKHFPIEFISDVITKSGNAENKSLFGAYIEFRGIVFEESITVIENNF